MQVSELIEKLRKVPAGATVTANCNDAVFGEIVSGEFPDNTDDSVILCFVDQSED